MPSRPSILPAESYGRAPARGDAECPQLGCGLRKPRAPARELARFLPRFDALICPILPTAAFPHDHEPDQERRRLIVNGAEQPYVDLLLLWPGVATLPGLPATAIPVGRTSEGLPIGVQIIGPWLEDHTTLELARLIEREFGGFVPPPAFAGTGRDA